MTPRRTNFVPGETSKVARRSATIAGNMMITFPMTVPSHQDSTRILKMMAINTSTRRKTMRKVTKIRRSLSRRGNKSRPSLVSGSPMVKPQVMMIPRRRSRGSPSMMMNHLYLHHPCVSWQEVTPT
jgi:hypothetical protein